MGLQAQLVIGQLWLPRHLSGATYIYVPGTSGVTALMHFKQQLNYLHSRGASVCSTPLVEGRYQPLWIALVVLLAQNGILTLQGPRMNLVGQLPGTYIYIFTLYFYFHVKLTVRNANTAVASGFPQSTVPAKQCPCYYIPLLGMAPNNNIRWQQPPEVLWYHCDC